MESLNNSNNSNVDPELDINFDFDASIRETELKNNNMKSERNKDI